MLAMSGNRERLRAGSVWEGPHPLPPPPVTRRTLRVGDRGRLVVAAGGSSVRIVAGEGRRVRLEARAADPLARELLDVEQEGDDVYVCTTAPTPLPWLRGRARLALELRVPAGFAVDVETRDGDVRIEDLTGAVEVRSHGGRLLFRGVAGCIEARTVSGPIAAERCSGELELRSVRGSIRIEAAGS